MNHPNRSASRPQIVVTRNSDGQVFQNLAGIFGRVFSIVAGTVRNDGVPRGVTYFDERYTITRAE